MNYERVYYELVRRGQRRFRSNQKLPRPKHRHHIIPKCLGGSDNPTNLVELTLREHRLAHKLLAKFKKGPRQRLLQAIAYQMYAKSAESTVKDRVVNSTFRGCYRREELTRLGTLWLNNSSIGREGTMSETPEVKQIPEVEGYITGVCKWFNNQKAFGFIELPGGGLDVFVHANQLRKSGIDRVLYEGEKVKFRTSKGPKGSFAVDISLVSANLEAKG